MIVKGNVITEHWTHCWRHVLPWNYTKSSWWPTASISSSWWLSGIFFRTAVTLMTCQWSSVHRLRTQILVSCQWTSDKSLVHWLTVLQTFGLTSVSDYFDIHSLIFSSVKVIKLLTYICQCMGFTYRVPCRTLADANTHTVDGRCHWRHDLHCTQCRLNVEPELL